MRFLGLVIQSILAGGIPCKLFMFTRIQKSHSGRATLVAKSFDVWI